jgi:Glycine zipper 2TM domain
MKNATLLLSVLASVSLASCAGVSPTRIIGDIVGAAGGALIGNKLSNGNRLITAAGAAAGTLLSESLQTGSNAQAQKSYDAGYEKARSDAAKEQFDELIAIFPSCRKDVELSPSGLPRPAAAPRSEKLQRDAAGVSARGERPSKPPGIRQRRGR